MKQASRRPSALMSSGSSFLWGLGAGKSSFVKLVTSEVIEAVGGISVVHVVSTEDADGEFLGSLGGEGRGSASGRWLLAWAGEAEGRSGGHPCPGLRPFGMGGRVDGRVARQGLWGWGLVGKVVLVELETFEGGKDLLEGGDNDAKDVHIQRAGHVRGDLVCIKIG